MKTLITLITLILGILLSINLVFALDITAGQNSSFIIPTSNPVYYEVIGNLSNLDGFSVYQDLNNITIVTDNRFKTDSFTLILFEEKTNEVIREVNVGGGGGTRTIYKNNTIYEKVPTYIDKIVNNETIKEIPIEKEIEISKPFYKNFWFYSFVIVLIISIISLILLGGKGDENKMS